MNIYKYHLIVDGVVFYVGLTKTPKSRQSAHKREKPPHQFCLIESFEDAFVASESERSDIEFYNTYKDMQKWNKDPGGNYAEASGFDRSGIKCGVSKGNIPWNKGLTKEDPRVLDNIAKITKTNRKNGLYKECGRHLPKLYGEKNHMKTQEHRKRMSELASRRYKVTKEDGSWTWGYRPL